MIDTSTATVTNITSAKADGFYTIAEVIDITITFSETVTVNGAPYLELETGTTDRNALYIGGSGTDTLTFRYTIQAGDDSYDLGYKDTGSLYLSSGYIRDSADNDAILTLPSPGTAG